MVAGSRRGGAFGGALTGCILNASVWRTRRLACTVKVKPGMPFKKLFEAAEVRSLAVCMDARLTEETL